MYIFYIGKCIAESIADNEINDFKIRRKRDKHFVSSTFKKQVK